jgi:hypothetical protein
LSTLIFISHGSVRLREGIMQEQVGFFRAAWRDNDEIDAGMLAVLAVLASYADALGVCWPSQGKIAQKCRRSRSWVILQINKLEALGILTRTNRQRRDGGERSCLYRLIGHDTLFAEPQELTGGVNPDSTITNQSITTLSPEREGPEIVVQTGWYPTDADLDKLWIERPDLVGRLARVGKSTRRFVEHFRNRPVDDIGAAWLAWMRREKVGAPDAKSGLAVENQAKADACLERIMARRQGPV